ncbi:MAG TPA: hypothetical protein VGS57_02575 [Thermoanaerobaculia bacterium]|nr:hypothetical protein [Thermoanaerobaculia bacterium]
MVLPPMATMIIHLAKSAGGSGPRKPSEFLLWTTWASSWSERERWSARMSYTTFLGSTSVLPLWRKPKGCVRRSTPSTASSAIPVLASASASLRAGRPVARVDGLRRLVGWRG